MQAGVGASVETGLCSCYTPENSLSGLPYFDSLGQPCACNPDDCYNPQFNVSKDTHTLLVPPLITTCPHLPYQFIPGYQLCPVWSEGREDLRPVGHI